MDIKNAPNHSRKNPPFLYYTMMISRPKLKTHQKWKKPTPSQMFDIAMRTIFVWYNNFLPLKYSLKKYLSWVSWIPDKIEKLFRLSWKFIWRISTIRHKLHLDCKIFDVRCAFWSYAPFNPNGPFTPNLDPLFFAKYVFFELSVSKARLQNRWPPKITFWVTNYRTNNLFHVRISQVIF